MKNGFSKFLRVVAIVLMGLTAVLTIFAGAGTTCVALAAEKFGGKMALIAPYKWLYILFVLVTLAIGVVGVRALVQLIKGNPGSYRLALITLIAGIVVGVIHITASRSIRGASMPVDAIVYVTVLTLIIFLILRIPSIWEGVGLEKPVDNKNLPRSAAAITLALSGLLTLTVQYWAGPTHIFGGVNYADAWHHQLAIVGWGMIVLGFGLPAWPVIQRGIHQLTTGLSSRLAKGQL